jgi:small-conductance mechanosensitive channel
MRWLWLAVFVLAFLFDLVGYVSLANLLGDAALGSLYLAVILYACTVILSGFLVIALHSRPLASLAMVRQHPQLLEQRLNRILTWSGLAAWAIGVLASLSVATAAFELAEKILSAQMHYGQIHLSLGKVIAFVLAIWASVLVSRFLRFVLEEEVYDRFALPSGIPYAISKMLNYVILLVGFFVAVSTLGYDMTTFAVLGSAFAVGIGFGMQNIVNNFVSGLILLFERPVKVGDVIQIGDTTGTVDHIGIRASIIRTSTSAEIIIPTGNLISNNLTNWTLSNRQRGLEITLATGAAADPKHVIELLIKTAAAHPLIVKRPSPEAFLTTFGADSFSYQLRAWTDNADQWIEIRSELSVAIHAALVKENIPIR